MKYLTTISCLEPLSPWWASTLQGEGVRRCGAVLGCWDHRGRPPWDQWSKCCEPTIEWAGSWGWTTLDPPDPEHTEYQFDYSCHAWLNPGSTNRTLHWVACRPPSTTWWWWCSGPPKWGAWWHSTQSDEGCAAYRTFLRLRSFAGCVQYKTLTG